MVYEKKKCVKNTFENSEKRKNTLKLKNVLTNETSTGKREKVKKE